MLFLLLDEIFFILIFKIHCVNPKDCFVPRNDICTAMTKHDIHQLIITKTNNPINPKNAKATYNCTFPPWAERVNLPIRPAE